MENQLINDTCSFLNQHYYNKSLHDEITHTKMPKNGNAEVLITYLMIN